MSHSVSSKKRILEIDFAKGVLITLMVMFHLDHLTPYFDWQCNFVYSFHMPAFLLLSGFLLNIKDSLLGMFKSLRGIVAPYLFFEFIYVLSIGMLGGLLGSNNRIDLSVSSMLEVLFFHPVGTYWYLHTLFFCIVAYHLCFFCVSDKLKALMLASIALFGICYFCGIMKMCNVVYFVLGCFLRQIDDDIRNIIKPSLLSVFLIVLIAISFDSFSREELNGLTLVVLMLSFLFSLYKFFKEFQFGRKTTDLFCFLGQNSLSIVVFSPMFTVITKFLEKPLSFDSTYIVWFVVSTLLVLALSLLGAIVCDKIRLFEVLLKKNMFVRNIN